MKKMRANKMAIFLFTFPTLLIFSVIVIYPLLKTLVMSLYEWDGLMPGKFVFLKNFQQLFTQDTIFPTALKNGIIFAVILPALPSAWKKGSVKGLRAKGLIKVDINWDEKSVKAKLLSEVDQTIMVGIMGTDLAIITLHAGVPRILNTILKYLKNGPY